jgi:hypothetical protein
MPYGCTVSLGVLHVPINSYDLVIKQAKIYSIKIQHWNIEHKRATMLIITNPVEQTKQTSTININ